MEIDEEDIAEFELEQYLMRELDLEFGSDDPEFEYDYERLNGVTNR